MSFTSLIFSFLFLPFSLILYYLTRGNKLVLIVVSLFFYAGNDAEHLLLLVVLSLATVLLSMAVEGLVGNGKRSAAKALAAAGIALNLAVLLYFKDFSVLRGLFARLPFGAASRGLPLGLSFFAFKAISLLVDSYRQKLTLRGSFLKGFLYLTFFSQIVSGPILRYGDMFPDGAPTLSLQHFTQGVERFAVGFSKKILIADTLYKIVGEVYAHAPQEISAAYAWLGAVCFSLQLYFDFSGYSDMAIGVSNMFGYDCAENFRYPYMTKSVSEFWRRWHITLGFWFRDYVYIPLGGSRVSASRLVFNLFFVWLLTGLWHGSSLNFIAWGLGYFVLIVLEKTFRLPERLGSKALRVLYRILCLLFINFQWVLFRSPGLRYGLRYILAMLGRRSAPLLDMRALFLLRDNWFFILAAVALCFPLAPYLEKLFSRFRGGAQIWRVLFSLVVIAFFVVSVSFLVSGSNNPFMYANF